jgi:Tol biopolymer transport system component
VTEQPPPAGRFAAGQRLDRYEIVAPLGVGGMGEVYRARDLRLAREVAVKVLPASLASDSDRLRRFEQEARATGSLDHPNVLVVHDVGSHEATPFLVTELLEGETLRERMEVGPVPAGRALEIAAGVARGLAAAHQKGIVHRDLKPDNVFLTRDGRVKILDFGLAKITGPLGVDPDAPTLAAAERGTMPGLLLGTAGYMSPEQVRGGEADPRSDIFALGVILYELLWDRRAFAEGSKVETLSAILRADPLEAPPPEAVSPSLLDLVRRCLEKDPEERFQSARDLAFALEAVGATEEGGNGRLAVTGRRRAAGPPSRYRRAVRVAVLVALSALAALGGERLLVPGRAPRITGYRALVGGLPRSPETWTTDGDRVYYTIDREGRYEVYQVPLVGGEPARLETPFQQARVLDASARRSAILVLGWDGGLTEWQSRDQTLWILPVPAGAARNTGLKGLAAAWSPDGERLAFSGGSDDYGQEVAGALFVGRGDGSGSRLVWRGDAEIPWVRWSPDGRRLRFDVFDRDSSEWWTMEVAVDGGEGPSPPRRVVRGERGVFSPDGRSFVLGRWEPSDPSAAVGGPRFDLYVRAEGRRASLRGETEPRPLTFGPLDFAAAAFTPDGRQIIAAGTLRRMELLRYVAARSRFERVADAPGAFVEYSRDGRWVAWVDPSSMTLWRSRRDGTGRLQLTVPPMAVGLVHWSPDGRRLLFVADPSGGRQPRAVYLVPRDGGRLESFSDPLSNPVWDPCWLDPSTVAWGNLRGDGAAVWTVDLGAKRVTSLPGSAGMMGPKCPGDGRVLAARSWTEGYWLYRPETDRWTDLGVASNLWYPTFARDGSTVYGLSRDERAIYRFRLDDGRRVKVAELGTIEPTAPWQEVWMGLDPDDAPLILRNTGFSDLFVLDWASR